MNDKKLYTSKEISNIYNVPIYTITHSWIPKGLKKIRGKGKGYLFKTVWVDEYLENEAEQNIIKENLHIPIRRNTAFKKCTYKVV